ncbi:MAG TPA: ABC transporter permease [Chitinophagaceae bacterium]|nr:ABC transporter permease [Chitinophagaceae bacterium]
MIKNYLKIAWRNVLHEKGYAFINVFGLAVGLTCFILILLFVQHELSYDRFYENPDRIYRVVKRHPGTNFHGLDSWAVTPPQLPAAFIDEFPEVSAATSIVNQNALLSLDEQHYWEKGLWADANFFRVFSFPVLQGNPETALAEPNTIVLTSSLANKIFGKKNPVGATLLYEKDNFYTVTGVIPDVPENSSIKYAFITSIRSQTYYTQSLKDNNWSSSWHTFFKLAEDTDHAQLQSKMPAFVEKHVPDAGDDPNTRVQYIIQPLSDVHLRSQFNFDIAFTGDIKYVYLFSTIGFLILLLACVNYTNLAVARSIKRTREVGLRKVIGANRRQLIWQFLAESVLMAFLAFALALVTVKLLLPFFSQMMERPIQMDYQGDGLLLPALLVLVVLVGLLSGSYPAFFMASLRPMQALTGKQDNRTERFHLQRLLMVGQYAVSIVLVAGSFVIYKQMQFVQQKELGFDREYVVTVPVRDETLRKNYEVIRNEWLQDHRVLAVTSSSALPTYVPSNNGISGLQGSNATDRLDVYMTYSDYDFLEVFGMKLAAGRTFSRQISSDLLGAAVINEATVRALGWTPEEALGKTFVHNDGERTIVGVVKDFHMHSMHMPIEPLVIRLEPTRMGYISAKVRPGNLSGTIASLEHSLKQFTPYPFEYQFLDEHFDQLYKTELRLSETFGFFTILALLIASLGLFGLAAYAAETRTKEIGIRKVLGASAAHIVSLLSKDFLKLVIIGFVIAVPIAWYAMNRWLEDFVYRIIVEWWVFALAGLLTVTIALLAVSFQSVKAALTNPVDSLRSE